MLWVKYQGLLSTSTALIAIILGFELIARDKRLGFDTHFVYINGVYRILQKCWAIVSLSLMPSRMRANMRRSVFNTSWSLGHI